MTSSRNGRAIGRWRGAPALILAVVFTLPGPVAAQPPEAAPARIAGMRSVLSALDPGRPATAADAARLAALLARAEAEDLSPANRRVAMTDFYREVWRSRGRDVEAESTAIGRAAAFAAGMFGVGARFSLEIHAPLAGAEEERIHVVQRGSGPVPMVLVSDVLMPAEEVYGSFMAQNAGRYTMYAVTLPGFGASGTLPLPVVSGDGRVPWLDATERQIAELIAREDLRDAVVVGTAVGSERTLAWTLEHYTRAHVWRQARYTAELAATDLTADLRTLKRPILVVASTHDHLSPGIGLPVEGQWTALRLRAPAAPISIVTLADVRAYPTVDAPAPFDAAVAAFLEGRPASGTTERAPATLASPFATTSLYVGASDLRVEYYRPAVRGREIWGGLVPYGQLWRTGANDAPRVTFSHDVTIEGQPLAAGTYTLLTVPGPREWILVFNRIPGQFGTFSYDPSFDALRVTVASRPAGMREWFEIAAEPAGPSEAVVTLRRERLAVPFRVALAAP